MNHYKLIIKLLPIENQSHMKHLKLFFLNIKILLITKNLRKKIMKH